MQSRDAITWGNPIRFADGVNTKHNPRPDFRVYSLWTPDSKRCGYSVRIQWVRLHDRAIRRRFSPGSGKLDFGGVTPKSTNVCSRICGDDCRGHSPVVELGSRLFLLPRERRCCRALKKDCG